MKKINRVFLVILISLSVVSLIVAGVFFCLENDLGLFKKETVAESVERESEAYSSIVIEAEPIEPIPSEIEEEEKEQEEPEEEIEPEPVIEYVENPYKDYYLENSDMIAWFKIPDTIVDFPVMYTPFDENYYLLKGFDKKYSGNGCLILDTDSSMYPSSTNLIIHGHNNKNAMFGHIPKYADKSYCDEHPLMYLYGKDCEHIYQVMAVFRSKVFYTTDVCFKYYKFFNAKTEEEFLDFYNNVMEMSLYDTGVTAEFGDKFLTLSTCSDHVENGRFVVVAKEIEAGEFYLPLE